MNHSNHAFKDLDQSLQAMENLLHETVTKILEINQLNFTALENFEDKDQVRGILGQAKAIDKEINAREFEIIALIQNILSKHTPRGRDLRFIIGSVKLSTLLESIADKIKNNIKRIAKTEVTPAPSVIERLREMMLLTAEIMKAVDRLLEGFEIEVSDKINRDRRKLEALYREVWLQETQVDAVYHNIVMLAKNIERNADMVSDIKKIIYFMETGKKPLKKKKAAVSE